MTKSPHQGFTLIEILIGMSLLSVMMLLLFASLRVCVRNWDAGEAKINQVSRIAIIQKFFKARLENTKPLQDSFSGENPQFSFQGDEHSLQFVSNMPASAGRLGLQRFTISLGDFKPKQGRDVVVDISPFFPVTEGEEWSIEQVSLIQKVETLKFRYFGSEDNQQPEWQNEWLEKGQLPLLVSIFIQLSDGKTLPEMVVALKIDRISNQTNPFENLTNQLIR